MSLASRETLPAFISAPLVAEERPSCAGRLERSFSGTDGQTENGQFRRSRRGIRPFRIDEIEKRLDTVRIGHGSGLRGRAGVGLRQSAALQAFAAFAADQQVVIWFQADCYVSGFRHMQLCVPQSSAASVAESRTRVSTRSPYARSCVGTPT